MIAVINYGMGNLTSVKKALDALNIPSIITNDPKEISESTHIILPGVGSFKKAMENLNAASMVSVLKECVIEKRTPILGICLGMQLLADKGFENEETEGLGFIEGEILQIPTSDLPTTHIGWNEIDTKDNVLFKNIIDKNFYFVHSFYFKAANTSEIAASVHYGDNITAAVRKGNIFGTQFHPEKSQKEGLKILQNFYSYA